MSNGEKKRAIRKSKGGRDAQEAEKETTEKLCLDEDAQRERMLPLATHLASQKQNKTKNREGGGG